MLAGATMIAVLVALASCSTPEPASAPPPEPGTGGTLVVAWPSDLGTTLPLVAQSTGDQVVSSLLWFPTFDWDFECGPSPRPALATDWERSADGTRLAMTLRDDIRFSDGELLTAEDVATTFDLLADPAVASPLFANAERLDPEARPAVLGPHRLEWRFTEGYDPITQLGHLAVPVMPSHLLADADRASLRSHPMAREPVATGPWRLATHEPGERFVLEPSPAFTGPEVFRPLLDRVVFRVIPDYNTRLLELQSGGVDLVEGIEVGDVHRLGRTHPEIRLERRGWRSVEFIAWNTRRPALADRSVREALALAVDVDDMISRLLTSEGGEAYGRRAIGTISPEFCASHASEVEPLPHDPERARTLLAGAGWLDTDGDGVVDRDGAPLGLTLTTNSGNARRAAIAVLVQASLAEVGVQLDIEEVSGGSLMDRVRTRDYDGLLAGISTSLVPDPSSTWRCETESAPQLFNLASYCNPQVDALIDAGLVSSDPAEAARLWRELQATVYADQPFLFLYWRDTVVGLHDRFQDTTVDLRSPLGDLHRWWVPEDRKRYPAPPGP